MWGAADGGKQASVPSILAWYAARGVRIAPRDVWLFDDKASNVHGFEGSGYSAKFKAVRLLTFAGILFGYAAYYLTRNSLTYTAPVMVATPGLDLDVRSIGIMTSIFPIAYGFSKFVSGVLGSLMSASKLLGLGLILGHRLRLRYQ